MDLEPEKQKKVGTKTLQKQDFTSCLEIRSTKASMYWMEKPTTLNMRLC